MNWILAASTAATLVLSGCAAPGGHAAHHGGTPAARHEHQMQSMSTMHQRMMAARTPDERRALMAEHMKSMQDGMRMMCEMGSGTTPESMKRCMDMHDMTVRMMMERERPVPAR